jgi:hypothetical protein
MAERLKRRVLALAPPVRCERCGEVLFRGVAVPWRGGLKVFGAEHALVRADWASMNVLVFRHVETEHCRERPAA